MSEERDSTFTASLIGILAGTRRSQAFLRTLLFAFFLVSIFAGTLLIATILWRVFDGSCVKGFGIEIGCADDAAGAVEVVPTSSIDLEKISYSYVFLPLDTGALQDCARVVTEVLRGRGFSKVSSNPSAWRSTREIDGSEITAAIQCSTTDGRYYFFGMTFGSNQTLVSDENKSIYEMALALNRQYSEIFTPRGGDIPYFHVSSVSFPIQYIESEVDCGKFAGTSLRVNNFFKVIEKPSYSYGDFNGGKVVAFCVRSYDSEEYLISVAAFGYATEENSRAVDMLVTSMRERRDNWIAANLDDYIAIQEPDAVPQE